MKPISPIEPMNATIPNKTILKILIIEESEDIIPRLLIIKRVRGMWTKMYKVTNMLSLRKGLRRDKERTTHQNIVVQGRAVAMNTYSQNVNKVADAQVEQYKGDSAAGTSEIKEKKNNVAYLEIGSRFIMHPQTGNMMQKSITAILRYIQVKLSARYRNTQISIAMVNANMRKDINLVYMPQLRYRNVVVGSLFLFYIEFYRLISLSMSVNAYVSSALLKSISNILLV